MRSFTFAYGSGSVSFELDEKNILGVLHGNEVPPLSDIPAALTAALEAPIGAPALREWIAPNDRIALVVSDMSRFWMRQDLVIPALISYLYESCGQKPSNITIVVANGTHIGGNEQELRTLVTDAVFDSVRVVNHDCRADDLVYLGTTPHETPVWINRIVAEADKVICLGACTHHVMAGYGGGRKSIVPGVAGLQTIRHNHAYSLDPRSLVSNPLIGNGVLDGNPLHEDMVEAAAMIPQLYCVTLVMNADMKLAEIYAGHYLTSWEAACQAVDRIYRVSVPRKADAIIASCGGFPKDMSLYQGTKTIDNIETGLKRGGKLILLIEARDGGGPEEYFDWIRNLLDGSIEKRLRESFTVPGYIFFLNCEQAQRYQIYLLTSIPDETVAPMGIHAYNNMKDLLEAAQIENDLLYVIPNGSTVIPYAEEA